MNKYPKRTDNKALVISPDYGKLPPFALEIEMAVLGSIITDYHYIAKYPYLKPEVFYKDSHRKIYKTLLDLYERDLKPDILILTDELRNVHELENVGGPVYLTQLTNMAILQIDTHVKIIMDKYFYRNLIYLAQISMNDSFDATKDPLDIIEGLQNGIMEMIEFDVESHDNFNKTLEHTLLGIEEASKGENEIVLHTGFKQLDKKFTFMTPLVYILAGEEGVGKSKFVTSLARGMLDNEPDVAIQWFTFEDGRKKIILSFLAMDVRKTIKELQSINYKMTKEDKDEVKLCSEKYKNYTIEFYDRATSIGNILSRSKRFNDKYKNKKKVIIIDNLGLIECPDKSGIDRDDFIAGKIKSIADNGNAAVILLHHFTKEIARKANLDDGYRPRKEYLKGSTRILDYAQQALFINLVSKHKDLLAEEKHLTLDFIASDNVEFTEANFDKYLWNLNSTPDKETKSITDLRVETFMKLKSLLNNNTKFSNGKLITFTDIIQKYTEYNSYIDTRNKGREEKYKTAKSSIYMFIVRKEFNNSYISSTNSPRSMYLYGNNPNLKNHVENLFIAESIKNRDDDNSTDHAIFRFICDLGYNLFYEINEKGEFEIKPKKTIK